MEGAQARLCAPARITVVLFEIVKHGCWYGRRALQRSIGRRSSLLGDWLRGPCPARLPARRRRERAWSQWSPEAEAWLRGFWVLVTARLWPATYCGCLGEAQRVLLVVAMCSRVPGCWSEDARRSAKVAACAFAVVEAQQRRRGTRTSAGRSRIWLVLRQRHAITILCQTPIFFRRTHKWRNVRW
jgi:hypothetical protein